MTQIGQVMNKLNPAVIKLRMTLTMIMMIPPQMVEYNIPNGPNRMVRISDIPTLFVDITTIGCTVLFSWFINISSLNIELMTIVDGRRLIDYLIGLVSVSRLSCLRL